MKKYDLAVIIGRFQPIHKGHIPAFKKANEIAKRTAVIIGSANKPSTTKNPFSVDDRIKMIGDVFVDENLDHIDVSYHSVPDTFYLNQEWYNRVRQELSEKISKILAAKGDDWWQHLVNLRMNLKNRGIDPDDSNKMTTYLSLHGNRDSTSKIILEYKTSLKESQTCHVAVLGHEKDTSSYYLKGFPDWDLVDIGAWVGDSKYDRPISATDIRELWFSGKLSYAKSNLCPSTYQTLLDWPENEFLDMKEEYEFLKKYKEETQVGPFPVQFLTTDAVVIHGDEILMIRRGGHPGKGLWALPGGFKGSTETFFETCIRELLEETQIALPKDALIRCKAEEKIFDYPERSSRGTTVSMAYSFILNPTKPRPRVKGGSDAVEAWWFPLEKLRKMRDQIFEDHLDIIEFMTARF